MPPRYFIHRWIRSNVALEVNIRALTDARTMALLISSKLQAYDRDVWKSGAKNMREKNKCEDEQKEKVLKEILLR